MDASGHSSFTTRGGTMPIRRVDVALLGALLAWGCTGDEQGDDNNGNEGGPGSDTITVPVSGGSFDVPEDGAEVTYETGSTTLTMTFPSSAKGETITISPATAEDVGWPDGTFADVVKLEPDGLTLADPVLTVPENGHVLMFLTDTGGSKSSFEPLPLSADGTAFELSHFSALVLVPPGKSCDSTSGWAAEADDRGCKAYETEATTKLSYGCKGYNFCTLIFASCCVTPATAEQRQDCRVGDPQLYIEMIPSGDNGSEPWCAGNERTKPACPTSLTIAGESSGQGPCSAEGIVGEHTLKIECDPSLHAGATDSCTCLKDGRVFKTVWLEEPDCGAIERYWYNCSGRVCSN